ncbi:MAG: succinate dehydrogenase, hydrophobic membrane anchor protein [Rhizobiales bacterium]|nr:succinate dehydrogenase, hydrophobic membrane anchor protein [Hyphomicrobiales bacterium]
MASPMVTPLRRVLGLGSAHEGTMHHWRQRLTGLSNLILITGFVILVVALIGRPHDRVVEIIGHPIVSVWLLLMVISISVHMRIGMQIVIEDYVHGHTRKHLLLILNTFFTIAVGAVSVFAILRIAFGVA